VVTKEKALKLALESNREHERHHTLAETRYWCDQYKLLAQQAIEALDVPETNFGNIAQPAQEPVAWQWLGSAQFRKKIPKNGDKTAWNPLYTIPPTAQSAQEPVAIDGNTSDGYHTFNELYEFRKVYNAALFNEWAVGGKCSVYKSWRHHDGELCFGGGWFIVVAVLPNGQISNHYEAKDWDLFAVPETERALFEFDGHTSSDVVTRLKAYTIPPQRPWVGLTDEELIKIGCDFAVSPSVLRALVKVLKDKNT
jgi:hypothetical protein